MYYADIVKSDKNIDMWDAFKKVLNKYFHLKILWSLRPIKSFENSSMMVSFKMRETTGKKKIVTPP